MEGDLDYHFFLHEVIAEMKGGERRLTSGGEEQHTEMLEIRNVNHCSAKA